MGWITNFAAHAPFLLVATPLFGAALVWISARRGIAAARQTAIVNASLTLCVACAMAWNFSADSPLSAQMTSLIPWWQWPLNADASPQQAVRFHLAFGVDGVSLAPLLIVALIGWVVVVTADRCSPAGNETSFAGILLGQALSMGLFAAQDFTLFIVCCELWAWWAFFLIGHRGEPERRPKAQRMLLAASLAHAAWGLAGIGMAVCHSWIQAEVRDQSVGVSFLYSEMVWSLSRWVSGNETALRVWTSFQPWVLVLWLSGLWLRWPLFPCHNGLAGVTAARGPVGALCGATWMLQSGYVLFRFVVPLFPAAGSGWSIVLSGCAGFGMFYFGLLAISATNWRQLGGYLTLSILQVSLLCGVSGSAAVSLTGWQTLCVSSLTVAGVWLLIGWREREFSPLDFDRMSNLAHTTPRWFLLLALGGCLLAAIPCFSVISGQAVMHLLELRRRGLPNLTLMFGGMLTAWAVLRVALMTGFGNPAATAAGETSTETPRDLRGRDCLIGVPIVAALLLGVVPGIGLSVMQPTWERLHDPFAGTVQSTTRADSPASAAVRITANKPAAESKKTTTPEFPWLCAPLFWVICGVCLLSVPRGSLTPQWESALATLGLTGGLLAEWAGGATVEAEQAAWSGVGLWSLGLMGLVQVTVFSATPRSTTALGGLLLRLSAIGWAAVTNDLLIAGLAWELAELARWLSLAGDSQGTVRTSRDQVRHIISSSCFWLGVALVAVFTQTTDLAAIAAQLAAQVPRGDDGQIIASASKLGLAAAILLCSAVGIRCGLLPWSFGRQDLMTARRCGPVLLDQWSTQLLGLTMLVQFVTTLSVGYGGPLSIMLAISAAATACWNGLTVVGEMRAIPLLKAITAYQFAGLVLVTAALAAHPIAASAGFREQFDQAQLLNLLAWGVLAITIGACGLAAMFQRVGEPDYAELFLEQYRGLFAKRRWEATLLTGLLIGLMGRWFWSGWIGWTSLVMTPLRVSEDQIQAHPVLLTAAVICLLAGMLLWERTAYWIRCLAFDPPVSLPSGSRKRSDLMIAACATAVGVIAACFPAQFAAVVFAAR